jgi:PAS domain S-box-containing protein
MDSHGSGEGRPAPAAPGLIGVLGRLFGRPGRRPVEEHSADEERLRAILETAPDAIVTADGSGRIVGFNRAAERTFGLPAAKALGAPLTTLMPERFHADHRAGLERFLATREPHVIGRTVELAGVKADGEEFPLELSLATFELRGETFFSGILADITERKRLEAVRQRLADIVDQTTDAILAKDARGVITEWNRGAERLYGYTAEEAIGQPITLIVPEDRAGEETEILERILQGRAVQGFDTIRKRRDGRRVNIWATISPLRDATGRVVGASTIARDTTEPKREEAQRAAQHEVSRIFVEATSVRGAVEELSRTLAERLGWELAAYWTVDEANEHVRSEAIWHDPGLSAPDFVSATGEARFSRGEGLPGRAWASGAVEWIEDVAEDPNFPRAEAAAKASLHGAVAVPIRRSRQVVGVMEFFSQEPRPRDVSHEGVLGALGDRIGQFLDNKHAEERIAEQAQLLDLAHDAIIVRDPSENRVLYWNREAVEIYGYEAEEALGQVTHELLATAFPESRQAVNDTLLERGRWEGELGHLRKDGRRIAVSSRQALQRGQQGEPTAIIEINSDVTDRNRAERERVAYRKELERSNAELEQFAYVASHDLQEPLRSIGGFAQLLERRYKGKLDADADSYIDFIVAGVNRMQALIDGLLSYSQAGRVELRKEQVNTAELLESALTSLDAAVREAEVEIEVGELPTIDANARALFQIFQNLLSNAVKFSDDRQPQIEVSADHEDGVWTFAVADNGIGIDPAQAERVFGMFQRLHARAEYGGTGIGLAICKRVVERFGGRIWCEPRTEGGTVFNFTIPDSGEPS